MEWSEVLDPELSPEEILCDRIPKLHRNRLEQFQRLVKTPLIFSFIFTDAGQQYTVKLSPDGVETTSGDMIDFPQATARGTLRQWRRCIDLASRLVRPADEQIDRVEGRLQVTDELKRGFEQFDGVLKIELTEVPDSDEPLSFEIVLNDYTEPNWAEKATLEVEWSTLVEVAHGRQDPVEASNQVKARGAMSMAFEIGGFFVNELDLE